MNARHMAGAIAVMFIVAGMIVYFIRHFEPRYDGQTLTQWLDHVRKTSLELEDSEHPELNSDWVTCRHAVCQMGTNAIPFLLDDLECKDSKVEPRASHLMHLKTVRSILPRKWYYSIDQIFLLKRMEPLKNRMRGVMGFWVLGTNASPAYPKLIE